MDQGNYLRTTDEGLLTRRLLTDMVTSSVVDPDSLNPDLTFQVKIRIRIRSTSNPDQIRIQGFYDQKLKKKIQWKIFCSIFFIKNCNLCTYHYSSIKDVRATGKAFSPRKRTPSTSKNEIY